MSNGPHIAPPNPIGLKVLAAEGKVRTLPAATTGDTPHGASFAAALQQSFARFASLPAIEGRHTQYSYLELNRRSAQFARAFAKAGVAAGDIVPLMLRRSPEMIVAQVALLRLGAAYAPIDGASPEARQLAMLRQIAPKVILSDRPLTIATPEGCRVMQVDEIDTVSPVNEDEYWHHAAPDALAYVMFTSGTTGVPKGAMVPQSGIQRLVCGANFANMQVGSRWAYASSPAFDASTLETWAPLLNGGCCVVQEIANPSIDDLADFLVHQNITDAWLTAALFSALVDDRLDSLRMLSQLLTGGERVSPAHARTVLRRYRDLHLINGYGPTENTTFTLCHLITLADTDNAGGIPIGAPISGTVVRVGADSHEPEEGELYAGGDGVALGYLGDPELTAQKFVDMDGRTWYRTGDIVRRLSGQTLEFVGRVDRQVKLQGHRVELDEVERTIGQFPGVSHVVVRLKGTSAETRHLVAHYTELAGVKPAPDALRNWLKERLAPQAIPSQITRVDRLPINANGKVDHVALDAEDSKTAVGEVHVSHEVSDTTAQLIQIWQRIFPTVSIHQSSSFQTIGGNSLTALQLSAQVRRHFGRDLTPLDILRTPVLGDQARLIETAPPFDYEPTPASRLEPRLVLTQIQRMMLAAAEFDESQCSLLVHVALVIPEGIEIRALKAAFEALAERHPTLRLHLTAGPDSTEGRIAPRLPANWWHEQSRLDRSPSNFSWPELVLRTSNRPLELSRDGVMRADVWPVADGSTLVVWTIHHIAIDEASIDRALAELDALLAGRTLPPVYGSPSGFATFEKAATDRDAVQEWSARLLAELSGHTPPLPRSPAPGAEFALEVPMAVSDQVLRACEAWSMTPFTPVMLAYGQALQDVFGPVHRFVSTPFSRRAEEDLVEPIGCLIDLRIVDAGLQPDETAGSALVRINQAVKKLQQPTFFPRTAVFEAIARRDAQVAQHLNMFGFTWRLDPSRAIPLGGHRAQLLRVPQTGARFGVTLHSWMQGDALQCSIEAVDAAIHDGTAAQVAAAFLRHLRTIGNAEISNAIDRTSRSELAAFAVALDAPTISKLRTAWASRLQVSPDEVVASSHFFYQGGNSLTAMRLASQLRREHGITIDVGEFLARPTFAALCAIASETVAHVPACSVMLGAVDAPNVIVIFPGNIGNPLGSYRLADELMRRMGAEYAVAIVDLETMLLRAPEDQIVSYVEERVDQLVGELGWNRIVAVAGLSSGGLLAFRLLDRRRTRTGAAPDIPVWLIDTYAPMGALQSAIQYHLRPVARYIVRHPLVARMLGRPVTAPSSVVEAPNALAQSKENVHRQLYALWKSPRARRVHLVQAIRTVRDVALLWRRGSNGFKTGHFAEYLMHPLDGSHNELSRELAPATAELIAQTLRKRP